MSESNGEVGAFLAGFVIGALVGAATALVLAPQSGAETRSTLATRSGNWRSVGTERLAHLGSTLADARGRDGEAQGPAMPRILLNRDMGSTAPGSQTAGRGSEPDTEGGSPADD